MSESTRLGRFGKEYGWLATIVITAFSFGVLKSGYDRDMAELKAAMVETKELRSTRWPVVEKLVREVNQLYYEVGRIEEDIGIEPAQPVSSTLPVPADIVLPTLWQDERLWKVALG